MSNTIYSINRGINKPIEFRGLKAQYISYLAIGLVCLLLVFAIGYIIGIPPYIWVAITLAMGFGLFSITFKYSHQYGQYGLMKKAAHRQIPTAIICHKRRTFLSLTCGGLTTSATNQ